MKPRSTVTALLAITEALLAARAAKARRAKPAQARRITPRTPGVAGLLTRSLWLRIRTAA